MQINFLKLEILKSALSFDWRVSLELNNSHVCDTTPVNYNNCTGDNKLLNQVISRRWGQEVVGG